MKSLIRNSLGLLVAVLLLGVLSTGAARAQNGGQTGEQAQSGKAAPDPSAVSISNVTVEDVPNDDGTNLAVKWPKQDFSENSDYFYEIRAALEGGELQTVKQVPAPAVTSRANSRIAQYYGPQLVADTDTQVVTFSSVFDPEAGAVRSIQPKSDGPIDVQLFLRRGTGDAHAVSSVGTAQPQRQFFKGQKLNNLIFGLLFTAVVLWFIYLARQAPEELFIRKISGLEALDEAIGRATEMGQPILYSTGLAPIQNISTIASLAILQRVATKAANFETELLVPCRSPVVMSIARETVQAGYAEAGRPDLYNEDNVWYLTNEQFAYAAAVNGIMQREKPAANLFMGYFYAESLLLAETGAMTGAIQVAGTDALSQLPFFITTCDYTLIGEELYAASAYLSRQPMLLGSVKGQDAGKLAMMILIVLGVIGSTIFAVLQAQGIETSWMPYLKYIDFITTKV